MILIGSTALKKHYPDFNRYPKDIDYAVDIDKKSHKKGIEYLYNTPLFRYNDDDIITPDNLYTLKVSHLFWDINWEKHMWDVQFLLDKGCKLNYPLFSELYEFWNKYHGKNKRSDLKMTANDFFNNAVKCPYDHDWLHTLIKNPPTFTKVLKDGEEVEVDEIKFENLSFEEKCDLVKEEVMIMAWERMPNYDYRVAYSRMLKKFIINHAPIWEALFIIENYKSLLKPSFDYFKTIENRIQQFNLSD